MVGRVDEDLREHVEDLLMADVKPLIGETLVPGAIGCVVVVYLSFQLIQAIKKSGHLLG